MKRTLHAHLIAVVFLSGCAATPRQYQGFQIGRDYYSTLSESQKKVFDAGADAATNDYMQRNYDAERRAMRHDLPGARRETALQKKIVPVLVQEHTGPDGVQHDTAYKFIELDLNTVQ